ncbi:hypothetical protein K443DRAFT_680831 [Laccaria amethystina LaAM-08-1]|uniref:Unplaced genomic scaffold K443scaffold_135, whole genome shotgun sequence n=1 Tax=Laccaria amethystina LaAM-08-1 TaxID=1095629 RepID=A0A0C9WMQ9_9AGAR|nr:hypothetical protein K443DRAFT_680831 [Laccaria amethystina LaAM-08-1]
MIFLLEISISFRVTPHSQCPKESFPDHDQQPDPHSNVCLGRSKLASASFPHRHPERLF